jgi:hypothetical protein
MRTLVAMSIVLFACKGENKAPPPPEPRPTEPLVRLTYIVAAPTGGPRAEGAVRALSERMHALGITRHHARVLGSEVSLEVPGSEVARVKKDLEDALRIDLHFTDDVSDPLFNKEKEVPFPTLLVKEKREGFSEPDMFLRTPKEHADALATYAAKVKIPDGRRLALTFPKKGEELVRTYLIEEPPFLGGECVESVTAQGDALTIKWSAPCAAILEKSTDKVTRRRMALTIDGRVWTCGLLERKIEAGKITVQAPGDAEAVAARAKVAPLGSDMKLVKEERLPL